MDGMTINHIVSIDHGSYDLPSGKLTVCELEHGHRNS